MATSPTQRTLKNLRNRGYVPWVVEYYHAYARKRKDLYSFIDVVALHPDEQGILGIQTTTGSNLASREKKARALGNYWLWLQAGNDVEFHGWRKIKHETKNIKVWKPIIRRVSMRDLL